MKRLIQYSILLVLAIGLATGILWARGKSHDELCTSVVVEVVNADSTSFVTPKGVLNDLKSQGVKLVGKRMGDINASDLEEVLRQSPYLENADIVKCQDGRVLIRVSQLVPVLRVFDGTESYYVNRAGKRMMATPNYHCDVPVVQGHFSRAYPVTRILPLVDYVEKDSLLHSLVTMYCVRDTNNIIIVPNISGHVVNIGNAQGFENKFAKLRLFYDQVMPKKDNRLKIRYSEEQMEWMKANESNVWAFFIQNNLLYEKDFSRYHNFVDDAPKTNAFKDSAPRTTHYIGWQIVRKYMENNKCSMKELFNNTDSQAILAASKYKP